MKILKHSLSISIWVFTLICFSQEQQKQQFSNLEIDKVVNDLCISITNTYFHITKGEQLTSLIRNKLKAGDFYKQPIHEVTKELTRILRKEANDVHFYVGKNRKTDNKKEVVKKVKINKNGGFVEVKLLENNIGYIKWTNCLASDLAFKKITSALVFLEGCDYLIFDITKNGGGDGRSSGHINKYLFKTNEYQNLLIKRCKDEQDWYQSEVAYNYTEGPNFFKIPVYIMVSKNTASAAEYFAFIAQEMGRATILGQKTAGAGNPVSKVSFGDFFAFIPICEIKTKEGKSIEAKGVVPDIELKSNDWMNETINYIISTKK